MLCRRSLGARTHSVRKPHSGTYSVREMQGEGAEYAARVEDAGNTGGRDRSTRGACAPEARLVGAAEHAGSLQRRQCARAGACGGSASKANRSTHDGERAGEGRKRRSDAHEESENICSESVAKMEQERRQLPRQPPLGVIRQLCHEAAEARRLSDAKGRSPPLPPFCGACCSCALRASPPVTTGVPNQASDACAPCICRLALESAAVLLIHAPRHGV